MSALNKLDMFEIQITRHAVAPQVVIAAMAAGMGILRWYINIQTSTPQLLKQGAGLEMSKFNSCTVV